ncbi:hypothetical protein B0H11DRAFT_1314253 [Mycena galericulata]|nr:hypothetical protein B0H11DRAFT_1314253 [Mycena galericulata]
MKSNIEGKNAIEGETQTREPRKPPRIHLAGSHCPTLERRKRPHRPKHAQGGPDAAMSSARKNLVIHRRKKSRSRRAQSKDESPVVLSRDMRIRIGAVLRGGRDLSRFESVRVGSSVRSPGTPTAQKDGDANDLQTGPHQDTPCPWVPYCL